MKNLKYSISAIVFFCFFNISEAQNINWRSLNDDYSKVINLNTGLDYASVAGIGYGQKIKSKIPILLNVEFSFPFGNNFFDDFKVKLGGQAEVIKSGNFSATIKAYGIFRRYQSDFTRHLNFGSEFSSVFGYYKPKWYFAGEIGFDKAIVTQIKHSAIMKEYNPEISDGWMVPTGGNAFYGIQSGFSFNSYDVYLKLGKTITQDFKTTATIPFYFQIGLNKKLGTKL